MIARTRSWKTGSKRQVPPEPSMVQLHDAYVALVQQAGTKGPVEHSLRNYIPNQPHWSVSKYLVQMEKGLCLRQHRPHDSMAKAGLQTFANHAYCHCERGMCWSLLCSAPLIGLMSGCHKLACGLKSNQTTSHMMLYRTMLPGVLISDLRASCKRVGGALHIYPQGGFIMIYLPILASWLLRCWT